MARGWHVDNDRNVGPCHRQFANAFELGELPERRGRAKQALHGKVPSDHPGEELRVKQIRAQLLEGLVGLDHHLLNVGGLAVRAPEGAGSGLPIHELHQCGAPLSDSGET